MVDDAGAFKAGARERDGETARRGDRWGLVGGKFSLTKRRMPPSQMEPMVVASRTHASLAPVIVNGMVQVAAKGWAGLEMVAVSGKQDAG